MDLHDSVAVVTGSNRGLGREFAAQLLERGAESMYATALDPESVQIAGVTPLGLDITDPDSVARAAAIAGDATLIINNAGILTGVSLIGGDLAKIELEMQTNLSAPSASHAPSRQSSRQTAAGRSSTSYRCCRRCASPPPVPTAPRRPPRGR